MEPGHEDREYILSWAQDNSVTMPQWSPVMKTGNTCSRSCADTTQPRASMEPGHEDREYTVMVSSTSTSPIRLNGARS